MKTVCDAAKVGYGQTYLPPNVKQKPKGTGQRFSPLGRVKEHIVELPESVWASTPSPSFIDLLFKLRGCSGPRHPIPPQLTPDNLPLIDWANRTSHPTKSDDTESAELPRDGNDAVTS